jgi:putative PIN family toxin of toxin-antitoxin system
MKIFVDTDVILDVLLERDGFKFSKNLLSKIEQKEIKAYTSSVIFTNCFYIISKLKDTKSAWNALQKLRLLFNVSKTTEKVIDLALASSFADFEDAVQYYTALSQKVDYFITRNKKDFSSSQLPILTPQECLVIYRKK